MGGTHAGEQLLQAGQFLVIEVREELSLDGAERLMNLCERRSPIGCDLDDVPASIRRVAMPVSKAVPFQVIEDCDKTAGVDAERLDERLLAHPSGAGEEHQGHGLSRGEPGGLESLANTAVDDRPVPREQEDWPFQVLSR